MADDLDISFLTSEDFEMLVLGTVGLWGDGKVSQKELNSLLKSCKKRLSNLNLFAFSDPEDTDLSGKEYIVELFDFMLNISKNSEKYDDIEIPEKFLKKKGKDFIPSVKHRLFCYLLDLTEKSYIDDWKLKNTEFTDEMIEAMTDEEYDENIKILEKAEKPGKRFKKFSRELRSLAKKDGLTQEEKDMIALVKTKQSRTYGFLILLITGAFIGYLVSS